MELTMWIENIFSSYKKLHLWAFYSFERTQTSNLFNNSTPDYFQ